MSEQRKGCSLVASCETFSSYLAVPKGARAKSCSKGCDQGFAFRWWVRSCCASKGCNGCCSKRLRCWMYLYVYVYVWCVYLCGCVCMYLRISSVGCCLPRPVRACACVGECMYVCVYMCICVRVCLLRMCSAQNLRNTSVFTHITRNHGTITPIYQNIIWCQHYCASCSFLMSCVYFCLSLSLCTFVPFWFSLSFP